MQDEHDTLTRLARSVSDGDAVDWEKELRENSGLRTVVERLRTVQRIGDLSQSPPGAPTPGSLSPEGVMGTIRVHDLPTWGPLTLIERIGRGSFGEVYLAHDPTLDRDVALKLRNPGVVKDDSTFLREARRLARIRHPNVLTVYGADRHGGRAGLWCDLIQGKTLEKSLADQGSFSPRETALIGVELCRALAAVHSAGLVHGDVKTQNIMREEGGKIVLMDFSSAIDRDPDRVPEEEKGTSGTPLFMAPELFHGEAMTPSSDIYSLGVVLYRLVSDRYPVEGESFATLREKHDRKESTPLLDVRPDLSSGFVQVVARALAHDPGDRYRSAGEMERALCLALHGESEDRREARFPPLRTWALAAAAALVIAAAVFGPRMLAAPFEARASLFRLGPNADERLVDGAAIAPGDQLFLEIEGSKLYHVYVVNEDDAHHGYLLFPLDGLDVVNPLPAGTAVRLPGTVDGTPFYWDVTSSGGSEVLLVVASRKPLPDLERELAGLTPAQPGGPVEIGKPEVIDRLRGIGGFSARRTEAPEGAPRVADINRRVSLKTSRHSGVWSWEIRLANPGT